MKMKNMKNSSRRGFLKKSALAKRIVHRSYYIMRKISISRREKGKLDDRAMYAEEGVPKTEDTPGAADLIE